MTDQTEISSVGLDDPTTLQEPDESYAPTAQTPALTLELREGVLVGEYRITGVIGSGGMGVVYSAVHPVIGKRAAIKVLLKQACTDPTMVDRFIDEARVVNKIGHPNIVDIFAFGKLPDGRSYFVMEHLQGESLRERIERKAFSVVQTTELVRPLARALHAAHEAGVVHRDLKPDNVFLVEVHGELPIVKLLDFGIAKLSNTDHRMAQTASGAVVGTPQYLSPEQARSLAVDRRADIYALGGIMFEMLTGRPPFIGTSVLDVVSKHLMEPPTRVSALVAGIPGELDDIILAMLSKEPAGRPTLAQLQSVLERVRTGVAAPAPQQQTQTWGAPPTSPPMEQRTAPAIPSAMPRMQITPPPPATPSTTFDTAPRRSRVLWFAIPAIAAAGIAVGVIATRGNKPGPAAAPTEPPIPAKPEPVNVEPPTPPPPTPPTPPTPVEKAPVEKAPVEKAPPKVEPKSTKPDVVDNEGEDDRPLTREERRRRRQERLERLRQRERREEGTINDDGLIEPGRLRRR